MLRQRLIYLACLLTGLVIGLPVAFSMWVYFIALAVRVARLWGWL